MHSFSRKCLSCLSLALLFFLSGCATLSESDLKKKLQAEKRFFSGMDYLEKNALSQAREEFLAVLEMDPSAAKAHNALGRVYAEENNQDLAEKEFQKAVALDGEFLDAYINLGVLYMKKKEWEQAVKSFSRLLKYPDRFPEFQVYNYIGWVYYEKGALDQSLLALKKAIVAGPNFTPARHNMGLTLFALGFEEEAIVEFQKAVEITPELSAAHNQLGLLFLKRKMYDKALLEFRAVITHSTNEKEVEAAKEYVRIIENIKN